jgi:VIT1/CCC1 family predicted Fe2+/Mn2+ transporter
MISYGATPIMPSESDIAQYRENLRAEIDGIALYRLLAAAERNQERAGIFRDLAAVEERHAALWRRKLEEAGAIVSDDQRPSLRIRVIGWLARRFGTKAVLPMVNVMETDGYGSYVHQGGDALPLAHEERAHGRAMTRLAGVKEPSDIVRQESWHRLGGGGALRASIFGINDGLVSNLSLVVGVAGAAPGAGTILLAGVAGLLAGAFSMAAGEYVSMRSQRELFERQIGLEKMELETHPEEEREELALIYRAKGIPKAEADRLAETIIADPAVALDTLTREELGLDPSELGSPWAAAGGSFVAFSVGAFVPVLPYLLVRGNLTILAALALGAVALFAVGASLSLFTGRHPLYSGARMLGLGAVAAAATYGIGRLIGASVSL